MMRVMIRWDTKRTKHLNITPHDEMEKANGRSYHTSTNDTHDENNTSWSPPCALHITYPRWCASGLTVPELSNVNSLMARPACSCAKEVASGA